MTNFYKWGDRNRKNQDYDKEKITITKAGKTYNVYDAIQAANVDTDIYEVMKKYHIMEDEAIKLMEEKGGEKAIFQDIRALQAKIKDIGDIQQVAQEAKEMFENLPVDIKSKYGNNLSLWFEDQKKKEEAEKNKQIQEQKTKQGAVTNETK